MEVLSPPENHPEEGELLKSRGLQDRSLEQQAKNQKQQVKNWGEAEVELLYEAKRKGFSDFQIARALWKDDMTQEHPDHTTLEKARDYTGS